MRSKSAVIIGAAVVICLSVFQGFAEKIDPVTHDVIPEPEDALYNRAPDPLPWIPAEMLTEDYWISRMDNPDEVIMTVGEIMSMNENYWRWVDAPDPFASLPAERKPVLIHWWPGFTLNYPELYTFDRRAVSDTVKVRIRDEIAYLRKQDYGNCLAITYSPEEIDAFEAEMAFDSIPAQVTVRHGITVCPARVRNVPSFSPQEPGHTQSRKTRWDLWNISVIKIGRPVQVLHISKSGEYLFVLGDAGYGWVRSENIAFASKDEIDDFVNRSDFVISTADRTLIYSDTGCTIASGWFGMGARLPLKFKGEPLMIEVPVRKTNGSFATETAWLRNDGSVHVGYVPYTRRNIVTLAFKLLGTPYDWTGGWYGRQHDRIYIDLFACFGFVLPNHGTLFTFYNDNNTKVLHPDMGKDVYYKAVSANEPFITLQSCGGHCQLFFGEYEGRPIVFDQHGYGYPDENDVWWEVRRCNIGDLRLPRYFLTKDVTFLELR